MRPARRMYLLKKVFQLRDHANPETEKPFLEHLEDLRVMITRVVITLVISMLACFTFQDELMAILRKPIDEVWQTHLENQLPAREESPKPLTIELWEEAKKVEHAANGLPEAEREAYYQALGKEDMRFHARVVTVLRTVLSLPADKQEAYLGSLKDPAELKTQVRLLIASKGNPESESAAAKQRLSSLKPTETFMLSMKLAFFAGIVVSFPFLLYFLLQFILPGLHSHEKKILWPALGVGFGLFLGGVLFAYFLILPRALTFFFDWSGKLGVMNDWRIGEYISFATQFTLMFGVAFELPVVVMVCVKLGLLSYETMRRTRSYAIVAIVVLAAVLTPTPDIPTQSLMAAPMILLYEGCIWLAWWDARKQRKREEAEARERMEHLLTDDTPVHDPEEAEEEPDPEGPFTTEEPRSTGEPESFDDRRGD